MIRRATLEDIEKLEALERLCFPEDAWGGLEREPGRINSIFLVFEEEDRIWGSILGWWILDELEVLRVAVAPEARRKGVGRALLMALEQEQQGIAACFLEVREDNLGAIALYEQAGYVKTGRRPAYYQDGCAAVLYHKDRVRAQVL